MDFAKEFVKLLGIVLIFAVSAAISAIPVMLLWNSLMPYLFKASVIDFWQAIQLSLLCQILFKSGSSK